MKVVFFIDHLRPDGAQRALSQITKGLVQRGHQIAVVCLNDSWDKATVGNLTDSGVEVKIVGKRTLLSGYGLLTVWVWLRARQFDCAVTMLLYGDVLGRVLSRLAGIPHVISSIRSRNEQYTRLHRLIVRATMALAELVVLNNRHSRDFAIAGEGARPDRIIVIPNGVNIPSGDDASRKTDVRSSLGLIETDILVGSIGRLSQEKGHDILIAAFARLTHSQAYLVLIGDGPNTAQLQAQADSAGVADRVHFVGHQKDVYAWLSAIDIFVQPSRVEGMSNSVLEAMSAGCPIVATAIDGNRELIDDGVYGWLVPPDDPGAMARAIDEALACPGEARRRGEAARERVRSCYSLDAVIDSWNDVLLSMK